MIISLTAICVTAWSQSDKNVYRVTAYKKGDGNIKSTSNTVEISPDASLYIPNAFTPNNDNINDMFGAVGEGITEFHMEIYDRWGTLVFVANDISTKWDGTFDGTPGQQDAYVYKIMAMGDDKKKIYKSGSVLLLN